MPLLILSTVRFGAVVAWLERSTGVYCFSKELAAKIALKQSWII